MRPKAELWEAVWEGFLHRPGTSCDTVILGEQVIKLGMGSWLDLWEKNSMYDLRPASCPCNFPLYSEVLANLMEVFYWPGTHQPAVNQRASQKVCTSFGGRPAAIAGSVFSRPNRCFAQVLRKRYHHTVGPSYISHTIEMCSSTI